MPGTLIICGTPIGNLADASPRLAETLESVDLIYAEDTRRTAKLLNHFGISTPMKSFYAGNEKARLEALATLLQEGTTIALVSDAGMPSVSDPGASAVSAAVAVGASVTVVPGPSAVSSALAISGFSGDRFVFMGFLPRKGSERSESLAAIAASGMTTVLFSAPSRIGADLDDLADACDPDRGIVVVREMTKMHEETWRGSLGEARHQFVEPQRARGEFTVVIEGAVAEPPDLDEALVAANALVARGVSTSDAVREIASSHGVSRRELYERVLGTRS
jgi:16S rRNA (cytidine1402-2'-O)-methyltransferase